MYGLKEVYKLSKKLPFYKCRDLINNARFALIINEEKESTKVFTTLRKKEAKKQVFEFLKKAKLKQYGIEKDNCFIILDNI